MSTSPAKTSTSSTKNSSSPSKMTDLEKQEWTEAAGKLLISGKRHLNMLDFPAALSDLAESSDLFSKVFGESSVEVAKLFLSHGKSLQAVSRLESGVLGIALQEESEVEGTEDKETDKKTDNQVESKLEQALVMLETASDMLELASAEEGRRKGVEITKGEVQQALGEIAMEDENYEEATVDFSLCLAVRQMVLPADSRSIAKTFYQLGVAQSFGEKYTEAEASLNSAIGVLEVRVKNLGAMEPSDNIAQEIRDLETQVKDVKIVLKVMKIDKEEAGSRRDKEAGSATDGSA